MWNESRHLCKALFGTLATCIYVIYMVLPRIEYSNIMSCQGPNHWRSNWRVGHNHVEKRSLSIRPYHRGDKRASHIAPLPCLLCASIFMILQNSFSTFHVTQEHICRTQLRFGVCTGGQDPDCLETNRSRGLHSTGP